MLSSGLEPENNISRGLSGPRINLEQNLNKRLEGTWPESLLSKAIIKANQWFQRYQY
jgi:hypothetical protein